jgi:cell wall integrity and stress response component
MLINCCADSSIFQSNGLCSDFCGSSYAFAVVQDNGCWCSNYVPGTTTTGCNEQCPGYPLELCGGNGVYGYIALGKNPSGTQGGSSAAPSSAPSPSSTAAQVSTPRTTFNMHNFCSFLVCHQVFMLPRCSYPDCPFWQPF